MIWNRLPRRRIFDAEARLDLTQVRVERTAQLGQAGVVGRRERKLASAAVLTAHRPSRPRSEFGIASVTSTSDEAVDEASDVAGPGNSPSGCCRCGRRVRRRSRLA